MRDRVFWGVLAFGLGVGTGAVVKREQLRATHAPPPGHIQLTVPVNWHPEPVTLAATRVDGPGGPEDFPVSPGATGPAWTVRVGATTYTGVRESPR